MIAAASLGAEALFPVGLLALAAVLLVLVGRMETEEDPERERRRSGGSDVADEGSGPHHGRL